MSEPKKVHEPPVTLPCAICRDLLPLVQDGVASPESEAAVRAHLQHCEACRALWPEAGESSTPAPLPDDEKVVRQLRRRVNGWLLAFIAVGLVLGLACSRSNVASGLLFVLIFPFVTGFAYWWGGRTWRVIPPLAAVLWAVFNLVGTRGYYVAGTEGTRIWLLCALVGAAVVAMLCLIGALAAALLKYAFGGKTK